MMTMKQKNILFKKINELKKIGQDISALKTQFEKLELNMRITRNYISKLFVMRQLSQLDAMFKLEDNENCILISRSMFEGAVYLGSFIQEPALAEDWRNYSFVIDQIRADSISDKSKIPEYVTKELLENKKIIDGFKTKKGNFYSSWTKGRKIKELATIAKLESYYEEYYSKMSEYHHWGTKSFGIRYLCLDKNTDRLDTAEIKLEVLYSWCMAISSILAVLQIFSQCLGDENVIKLINDISSELHNLNGLKTRTITYSNNSKIS
ncbi:hypothetical protein FXB78_02360 [Aggregatibacter actinomycetemcomitans]|uniref:DUF5677 domain-containing protein n=2 Tax=Aggregatibacter actinomycetemcomitans TaxID=714 RepID=UPI0011D90857|nr:DUF5677 domain-containing protein [Aggregatibacter actinomycetemcomitans]TYA51682.1 hypothetical protein FXB81_02375 [Aggregatibacter actinomycetemcomitans]TYB29782.1 hypothetical protein FXB78_02360 [Aggregatibacter actinomycetemcomitans]